jgi:23S rRNA (uracil1939-C5)-methyltransferase
MPTMSRPSATTSDAGTFEVVVDPLDDRAAPPARPRHGGEPVRVPHGVPGDRLLVRRTEPGWAAMVEILAPSPDRVDAPCPHADTCGNCPWMSIAPAAQRRARERLVYACLERQGVTRRSEIPGACALRTAGPDLGYRTRARFQVGERGRAIGFHRRHAPRVVDIARCPLLAPPLAALYRDLRRVLQDEPVPDLTGLELMVAGSGPMAGEGVAFLNPRDRAPAGAGGLARGLLDAVPALAGVAWPGGGRGRTWLEVPVGPADPGAGPTVSVRREAGTFSQVHDRANTLLVQEVLRALAPPPRRILELYAGSGNLSLPLVAAGHRVRAVETDARAVAAMGAARPAEAPDALEVEASDAGKALRRAATGDENWNAVLLDPPRSGFGRLAGDLLRLRPARLVAVSCRPGILARDLPPLIEGGYRVTRVVPLDFFPHTPHLEVVVRLDLAGGDGMVG